MSSEAVQALDMLMITQVTCVLTLFDQPGWLGWAIVLGSFQCQGVLLLWHMVGQGPAVLAAGAGRLSYLPFLMPHPLGAGHTEILWTRPL